MAEADPNHAGQPQCVDFARQRTGIARAAGAGDNERIADALVFQDATGVEQVLDTLLRMQPADVAESKNPVSRRMFDAGGNPYRIRNHGH